MKNYPAQQITAVLNVALDNIERAVATAMVGAVDAAVCDLQHEAEAIERHIAILLGSVARLAHTQERKV